MEIYWDYHHDIPKEYWPNNTDALTYNQQIQYYQNVLKKYYHRDVVGIITTFLIWPYFDNGYLMHTKWKDEKWYPSVVIDSKIDKDTGNQCILIGWPGWGYGSVESSHWNEWINRETNKERLKLYDIKCFNNEIHNELKKNRTIMIRRK